MDGTCAVAAKPIIAVVDDDIAVRSSLAFAMEGEGFLVRPYGSAEALLEDTATEGVRCFVVDYKLPGIDGLELVGELRKRHIRVPAILITTHPRAALRRAAASARVPIVEKPLLGDALSVQIRDVLKAATF